MDSIKSIIENNKIRGRSNEYENKYQGFKFMPDSDGKTRFMSSDGSIKIRVCLIININGKFKLFKIISITEE